MKFGSVCSGIEAASLAFKEFNFTPSWFSEISEFPSKLLNIKYPEVKNFGDMTKLPELIRSKVAEAPDILCGGTPCQAFSFAGWQNGLTDERGQLTLKFIEVADAIDEVRTSQGQEKSIILWENVEGALRDKTNAFGNFIAGLAGCDEPIEPSKKWTKSGMLLGPKRNIAWRVLDAKFFGLPQQRKRLFVVAVDKKYMPDKILFEEGLTETVLARQKYINKKYPPKKIKNKPTNNMSFDFGEVEEKNELQFKVKEHQIEFFRNYTDCLYSAYGTKWNGNAAAYNGSLYISQNNMVRRFTPIECERLMGFPDNYTLISENTKDTPRYQAVGNSWAVPVVNWIGKKIDLFLKNRNESKPLLNLNSLPIDSGAPYQLFLFEKENELLGSHTMLNLASYSLENYDCDLKDYVDINASEKFYISNKARRGIIRRKTERKLNMSSRLELIMSLDF